MYYRIKSEWITSPSLGSIENEFVEVVDLINPNSDIIERLNSQLADKVDYR